MEVMQNNLTTKAKKPPDRESNKKSEVNYLIRKLKHENPSSYRHIIALIKIILNKENQ